MKTWLIGFWCLGVATTLSAQVVENPNRISFQHDDWGITEDYEIGYFSSPLAVDPVISGILPKPEGCNPCQGPLVARPLALQVWWVAVRARMAGGTVVSNWSTFVSFGRSLAPPYGVILDLAR